MRLSRFLPPPRQAPKWAALASRVPARCPYHGVGCAISDIRSVSGGHDRAPVIDVTYECHHTITIPVRAI